MPNILIVDDDPILAIALSRYLDKRGYCTEVEGVGERVVARILAERPDAVILDANLPGTDGFAICSSVRSRYSGMILMLTAHEGEFDRILSQETGADEFVTKPAKLEVIEEHLQALLRQGTLRSGRGAGD